MLTAYQLLCVRLKRFARERAGNVAITFAIATVPVVGAVGAAVDYSHANSVKTAMQTALDSTALMLAKTASTDTSTQLQTMARNYFNALFTRPEATNVTITATYTSSGGSQVVVNGSVDVPTAIMGIAGINTITVTGSSTAAWGTNRLRVALVLDNTGSMAQSGKLTALKTATTNLLSQLQTAATTNGDVYVSIIPFVKDVNVGASNYTANWIYWGSSTQDPSKTDNTSWNATNGTCSGYSGWSRPNDRASCRAQSGTWTAASHSTWNGCVMDRGYPASPSTLSSKSGPDTTNNYDTNVSSTDTTKPTSLYPAEQYSSCPSAAVMALSYNWSAMNTLVNNMTANGNTNQAVGLQLGWLSLVGGGPFPTPPAMASGYNYSQVIILLTDGLNTQDRWYTSQSSIDARQQITCDNFKNSTTSSVATVIYTIQVNTDNEPTSTLLQNCASSPDKFYLLTSASQIIDAFNDIGTNLSKLRVAR